MRLICSVADLVQPPSSSRTFAISMYQELIASMAVMWRLFIFIMVWGILGVPLARQGLAQDSDANIRFSPTENAYVEELRLEVEELRRLVAERNVSTQDLLEPPIDPQRLVHAGDSRGAILLPGTDVSLRIGGYARGEMIYDTGYVAAGTLLVPGTVALDGSPLAQRRGQTTLTANHSRLNFDAQTSTDFGKLRGFIEFDFYAPQATEPRLRHAYGEWKFDNDFELIAGQTWSTFMDPATLPQALPETAQPGSIFVRQGLFRVTHHVNDSVNLAFALENPGSFDFTLPDPINDQPLQRWPDFVSRIQFASNDIGTFQIASLVRGIGYEDQFGDEHLRTGWGVALTSRVQLTEKDNLRMGVTGGEGIGGYMLGLAATQSAAAPDLDGFRTLGATGAYISLQHFFSDEFRTNMYYGLTRVESTPLMPSTAARDLQNAAVNLIWSPRPGFGAGIEYNYNWREVRDLTTGDNHRIQFTIQFGL